MSDNTYEYKWVNHDDEQLNKAGKEGWHVVPGVNRDLFRLLMERVLPHE